jgi:hypothetical protein
MNGGSTQEPGAEKSQVWNYQNIETIFDSFQNETIPREELVIHSTYRPWNDTGSGGSGDQLSFSKIRLINGPNDENIRINFNAT